MIPTERLPGPAERARDRLGVCRLGEGLTPLGAGEVEVAVIAGMGGHAIRRILQASPAVVRALERLVLQPQQHARELRAWLDAEGYDVLQACEAIDRGRRYTVLTVRPPR